jgi:D-glycero-D-manno-heptose 1,7-bisphosphate phosphatase
MSYTVNAQPIMYMMVGFQASTKSTKVEELLLKNPGAVRISRDTEGGSLASLLPKLELAMKEKKTIVLDNTHLSKEIRRPFIQAAQRNGYQIECIYMKTTIEDCQIRALHRVYQKFKQIFLTGKSEHKDPHIFPPSVLFAARKTLEEPDMSEGFAKVNTIKVESPTWDPKVYNKKALFLDIDGTLRATEHLENKYPVRDEDVVLIRPPQEMLAKLESYRKQGYLLIGVSNQSGVAKKILTESQATHLFDLTRTMIGYEEADMPILFCPHQSVPISCYCRKPQSGMAMTMIESLGLNPRECIMVGDRGTDKSFAARLGMKYIDVGAFW